MIEETLVKEMASLEFKIQELDERIETVKQFIEAQEVEGEPIDENTYIGYGSDCHKRDRLLWDLEWYRNQGML